MLLAGNSLRRNTSRVDGRPVVWAGRPSRENAGVPHVVVVVRLLLLTTLSVYDPAAGHTETSLGYRTRAVD